ADVNGDNKPDVLVATNDGGAVDVLLGVGDGTLQKPLAYAIGAGAYALAVTDVNQDGWPDILVPNINTNLVTVLLHLNPAPTVATLNLSVKENGVASDTLSATDAYGLPLTYSLVNNSAHGMLSNFSASTGAFTYTPATNYLGSDGFKWQVSNSHHATATAMTNITVSNTPPPVASNGSITAQENTAANGTLSASGSGTLTFAITTNPARGTVKLTDAATGAFTYTPASGFTGSDSFTFTAANTGGMSNAATENITVTAPAAAPTAINGSVTTSEGATVNGNLSATGSGTLTYAAATQPSHGTLTVTAGTGAFTYTPSSGFSGSDSFTFTATNAGGTSNPATESITVSASSSGPGGGSSSSSGKSGGGALGFLSLGLLGIGLGWRRRRSANYGKR
ncbi:MAG: Ig-like domain-containing protein, partial [Gammaproteobacteria bacterium]